MCRYSTAYGQSLGDGLPIAVSVLAVVMGLNLLEVILVEFPSFGRGGTQNRQSTDDASPPPHVATPPYPCVCMSNDPRGKVTLELGRVHFLHDPPVRSQL
jgi:hypothetical protein